MRVAERKYPFRTQPTNHRFQKRRLGCGIRVTQGKRHNKLLPNSTENFDIFEKMKN
jgi:hypothetical protein